MKIIETVIIKQKEFDYNYYLQQNAPLPHDWKNRKQELKELAKKDPKTRGQVYKELFEESNSLNEEVSSYL